MTRRDVAVGRSKDAKLSRQHFTISLVQPVQPWCSCLVLWLVLASQSTDLACIIFIISYYLIYLSISKEVGLRR